MWLNLFFFKQKTAYEIRPRDWSSDVCSSDLVARIGVEVGAGDADHPGLLGMPRRMQHARPVGAGVAGAEAVVRPRRKHPLPLALRIDPPPFGHLGDRTRRAIHRPRRAVAVRRTLLRAFVDMRQHID